MKNKLLALIALCGATSSTMPLWAQTWDDPELEFAQPNFATDGTGGGTYYLYHVATGKFAVDGNWNYSWGTELVVDDEGKSIEFYYGQDYELSSRDESDAEYNDAYGWRMTMWEGNTNTGMHELYIPSELSLCVDHEKQGHMLWKLMDQGDGYTYRIKIADEDPTYGVGTDYENTMIGVNADTSSDTGYDNGVNPLILVNTAGFENAAFDWKFVTEDVYTIYQAKKTLKTALEYAVEQGYSDYSEYDALYRSSDATAEELEEAAAALTQAVIQSAYSEASESNPVDVSSLMTNPTFDGNYSGWTAERSGSSGNFQYQSASYSTSDGSDFTGFFEYWIPSSDGALPDWSITQELSNLPNGGYRLTAYVLSSISSEPLEGAYVVAKGFGPERRTEATVQSPDGAGYAMPFSVDFTVQDGTATVGFRVISTNSNWIGVDNFKLEYMGPSASESGAEMLEEYIAQAEALIAEYDLENAKYSLAGQTAYEELLSTARTAIDNAVSDDSLVALAEQILDQMDVLASDVAAYDEMETTIIPALWSQWEDGAYADADMPNYEAYVESLEDAVDDRTFDPLTVDSVETWANEIYVSDLKAALASGDITDVTGMLTNATFDDNSSTGWTVSGASLGFGSGVAEVYVDNVSGSSVDVYQELTDLPAGTYEVSATAFYRPSTNDNCQAGWGVDGDTTNDILAYLYGNDGMTKLPHCYDYVYDSELAEVSWNNDVVLSVNDEERNGKYAVNNLTSANVAFNEYGDFKVSVKCYVTSDGVLKLGVKIPTVSSLSGYWMAFDNFEVTYLGADDMSGAESTLQALVEQAQEKLEEDVLTTQEALDGLTAAIASAEEALEDELTVDIYNEQTASLNAAIEAAQAATDAANELETLATEHDAKFTGEDDDNYDAYQGTDGYDELESVVLDILDIIDGTGVFTSMEEIEDYVVKLGEAYGRMVAETLDYSDASLSSPADLTAMIVNPSFDNAVVGWTETNATLGGGVATSVNSYEFYNVANADLQQTVYSLPQGYYRLYCSGFYRAGSAAVAALAHRDGEEALNAELYVKSGANDWSQPLASIFECVTEYKYASGDVVLADSLFPDMTDIRYHCVVNGVTSANMAVEDGYYENSVSFYVEEGQAVVLGVRKEELISTDWTYFDNFRLEYYGDGEANQPDDYTDAIGEVVADGTVTVVSTAWYTVNGVRVDEPKQRGIYIRQDVMSDGSKRSGKVIVK